MGRCAHEGLVERIDLPAIAAKDQPARSVWQCSACGVTWPEDPRILAARFDGLAEAIVESFPGLARGRLRIRVEGKPERLVPGTLIVGPNGEMDFESDDGAYRAERVDLTPGQVELED